MPAGGGSVYQPTTVSYEPRPGVSNSAMGVADSPLRVFRKPRPQVALLLFAIISLIAGVGMLGSGAVNWLETEEILEETGDDSMTATVSEIPFGVIIGGVFMIILGFVGIGVYLRVAGWRRNCVCPCGLFDKKQSLARQMQCQNGGAGNTQGIIALNPSTDPLVSHTQYAAVSELPSLRPEDDERRNLMPDNKDCLSSAEESDRMLEPDPRIVLRPMERAEDA